MQECSAKIGTGVEQALDWLLTAEASKKRKKEVEHLTADAAQIFAAFHARQVRPPGLLSSSCFSLLLTRAPILATPIPGCTARKRRPGARARRMRIPSHPVLTRPLLGTGAGCNAERLALSWGGARGGRRWPVGAGAGAC